MGFKISFLTILILFSSFALQAATKLDACALFTKPEAEAVLGEQVKDGKHGIMENDGSGGTAVVSQCIYRSSANFNKSADLVVRKSPASEKISASIPSIRKNLKEMSSSEPQNISGVGDQAFWAPVGQGDYHSIQLNVFRGDSTYLIISVKGFPDQQSVEKAKTIAQKLLSRLPS
jgi:hypothetical protein